VDILHAGVVVATHVQRLRPGQADRAPARVARKTRDATKGPSVIRLASHDGQITFAGTTYRAGRMWARTCIEVIMVAGSVQLPKGGKLIRVHPIRHERSREFGAFADSQGRARCKNSATGATPGTSFSTSTHVATLPFLFAPTSDAPGMPSDAPDMQSTASNLTASSPDRRI
jgi:hypothetical protein